MGDRNIIKKILVAIDGSKASNRALSYAVELAETNSAELEILTVVPPIFLPSRFGRILSKAKKEIQKKNPKIRISTRFEKVETDKKILEIAKVDNFDLIVMGSRRLNGGVNTSMRVSSKVGDKVPCPILIIK